MGRSHGLAGAFVVEDASDDPERFAAGATVYVGREPAGVVESKRSGGRLVVRLDRTVARGAALEIPVAELPPAGEDEYYVHELVGLRVEEEGGRVLGRVRRPNDRPASDAPREARRFAIAPTVRRGVHSVVAATRLALQGRQARRRCGPRIWTPPCW